MHMLFFILKVSPPKKAKHTALLSQILANEPPLSQCVASNMRRLESRVNSLRGAPAEQCTGTIDSCITPVVPMAHTHCVVWKILAGFIVHPYPSFCTWKRLGNGDVLVE